MHIDELIELFEETGFTQGKYIDWKKVKPALEEYHNGEYPNHKWYTVRLKGKLMGYMSRIQLWDGVWMCHHHAGYAGYGNKVLRKLTVDVIRDAQAGKLTHLCSYYRTENKYPEKMFGGRYRAIDDESLCTLTEFAYAYPPGCALEKGFYEMVCRDSTLVKSWPRNFRTDLEEYGHIYGHVYNRYSAPGLSLSNFTNCQIYHLHQPIDYANISKFARPSCPILWTPVNYLTGIEPQKVYNFWKLKMNDAGMTAYLTKKEK